jgi:hypothetical protein
MTPPRPLPICHPLLPVIGAGKAELRRRRLPLQWRRAAHRGAATRTVVPQVVVRCIGGLAVTINVTAFLAIAGVAGGRPEAPLPTRGQRTFVPGATASWRAGVPGASAAPPPQRALRPQTSLVAATVAFMRGRSHGPVATVRDAAWRAASPPATGRPEAIDPISSSTSVQRAWRTRLAGADAREALLAGPRYAAPVGPSPTMVRVVAPNLARFSAVRPPRGPLAAPMLAAVRRPAAPSTAAAPLAWRGAAPATPGLDRHRSLPSATQADPRIPTRRPAAPLIWQVSRHEAPLPKLSAPNGADGSRDLAYAAAVAIRTVPATSPTMAAAADTGRLVDEVMRRLDQRLRNERLRRGI